MLRAWLPSALLAATAVVVVNAGSVQKGREAPSIDLVTVDVVVVDKQGQPVHGLTQKDFTLKEDGKSLEVVTFQDVSPATDADDYQPRSLTIFLDDAVASSGITEGVRTLSRGVLQFANPKDEASVVRLNKPRDEPFGDRRLAEERIAGFRAGAYPFIGYNTQRDALHRIADVANQLAPGSQGRKILLCIGSTVVCNIDEPTRSSASNLWDPWMSAMSAAARANLSVYAIVPGRPNFRKGGLVDLTGGTLFPAAYDVGPAVERILRDAANYYVLGYWPSGKLKDLYSIDVKVNRSGLTVQARRRRGH